MSQLYIFVSIVLLIILWRTEITSADINMYKILNHLNKAINPSLLLVHDQKIKQPAEFLSRCENSPIISTIRIQDFLQLTSNNTCFDTSEKSSSPCNGLYSSRVLRQVVLIEMKSTLNIYSVFEKISAWLHAGGWRPVIIVHYTLEGRLQEHLEILKKLVVKEKISANTLMFVVIDNPVSNLPSEFPSKDSGSNITPNSVQSTIWEVYAIKDVPIVQEVRFPRKAIKGIDTLAKLRGQAVRRFNFIQVPILGAAENNPDFPLESQLETYNGEVRFLSGYSVDLFQDLEYALNFRAKAVQGQGWITKDEVTSEWMGTGRQIMAGEVDIGISITVQYPIRADFALLMPNYSGSVRAYFRQPPASSIRDIFEYPFSRRVWIVMVAVFVFTYLMLKLMIYCKTKLLGKLPWDFELGNDSALFVIASICQQGWHMHPKSACLKIIFICTTISGFLMYVSFSGALVSTLTNEIEPIRSLEDLMASSLTLIGDKYIPLVRSRLESIYNMGYTTLEKNKIAFDSSQINPGLRVINERCAYLGFSDDFVSTLRTANKSDKYFCDHISNLKVTKNRLSSGMVVRKDSPFREYFNYGIIKNFERGLNHARTGRYIRRSRIKCNAKVTSYREDLEAGDVFTAYIVLAVGVTCSLVLASIERYYFAKRTQLNFRNELLALSPKQTSIFRISNRP